MDYKEKIRNLYNEVRFSDLIDDVCVAKRLEDVFPELKEESEDERIRKELIWGFKHLPEETFAGISINDVIFWFEKQGESKPIGKLQLSEELYEHIRNTCACIDDALSSETLADINDYLSMAKCSAQSAFDMIEKQGEQNLIMAKSPQLGEQKPVPILDIEIPFGAKDSELQEASYYIPEGFHTEIEGNRVVIKRGEQKPVDEELKKLLRAEYEKGRAKGKAQTLCEMPKEIDSQVWQIANNAAITWEQSFAILMAAKNAYDKGKADAIVQTPPVWTEEDERMFKQIIALIETLEDYNKAPDGFGDAKFWLKSLKERVIPQSKQEWSEEDETHRHWILEMLKAGEIKTPEFADHFKAAFNWLKSLRHQNVCTYNPYKETIESIAAMVEKYAPFDSNLQDFYDNVKVKCKDAKEYDSLYPQNRWKPSDEQMEALADALSLAKNCGEESAFDLRTLYEQLKKLREE